MPKIEKNISTGSIAGVVVFSAAKKCFLVYFVVVCSTIFCLLNPNNLRANPPDWIPEAGLQYAMQVVCKVELQEGGFSQDPQDILGAFVGAECRGIASPLDGLEGFYFLSVASNQSQGEIVSFKVYLAAQDQVFNLNETLVFEHLGEIGDITLPFIFTIDDTPPLYHIIEASASVGGTISPEGNVLVEHGFDQAFIFTPETGYSIANVMVDGNNLGDIISYTFEEVDQDHVIHVSFQEISLIIEAKSGDNGSIFPSGTIEVLYGESQLFEFLPDVGFQIEDVVVDNSSQGPITYFLFDSVTENHSINVSFTTLTGFSKIANQIPLKLYPNPAGDKIFLQLSKQLLLDDNNTKYKVSDALGQLVVTGKINEPITIIDLTGLKAGAYILELDTYKQSQLILKK